MAEALQPILEHMWFYPPDSTPETTQPGVGIITTTNATILVDAGNGPRHARQIRTALRQMDAPPVQYVLYTHHHWDHTFGGQVWTGSLIAAHDQCRALLLDRYGSHPWNAHAIQEQASLNPARAPVLRAIDRAVDDWSTFRLALPHITFSHRMILEVDDLTLTLEHIGGQHAADSMIIHAGSVLFLGDCYYPPPHLRQPGDTPDYAMMEMLLEHPVEIYIDAHHGPMSRTDLEQRLTHR
ncbi:MAG: MBL fold metallo-hydrolase [Anaerolineae bacterium]|nr:MBL fold metallo-hydrolase [Anaerolineae bacterium]